MKYIPVEGQFTNAMLSMLVTLAGMVTLFKLMQNSNALFPILLTLMPIARLLKLTHSKNA